MSDGFLWSVKNGDEKAVREYIDKGVDVNSELASGRCGIHFAADYGQTKVIECLLKAGADINKTDKHGITPLLAAIWENHCDTVKLLLKEGAKKDGKAPDGSSYIESAEDEAIKKLLE